MIGFSYFPKKTIAIHFFVYGNTPTYEILLHFEIFSVSLHSCFFIFIN